MKVIINEKQFDALKDNDIKMAVIEITIPMAYLSPKDRFQIIPYWKTLEDRVYILNRGVGRSISRNSINVRGVFGGEQEEEMNEFLNKVRDEYWEKVKQYYK